LQAFPLREVVMQRLRRYPDSRIIAVCPCLPVAKFVTVTFGRLPAYSGATVPAFNRLPARKRERLQVTASRRAFLVPRSAAAVKSIVCTFVLLLLAACSPSAPAPKSGQPARRIVSLVPSLTEDLCAIGAAQQLAGVSAFSGDIPCARGLPEVNNFAALDTERIVRLHPDVVVGIPAQRSMTAALRAAGVPVVLLRDDSYKDLFGDIERLGAISGHAAQSRQLKASLERRTAQLRAGEHFKSKPSVFFAAQALPLWTIGPQSYIATMIELAGGRVATASLTQSYAQYSTEALVRLDPDAIVATSDARLDAVLSREPWRSLRAVREHHVYILRDGALLVRPGPRYNEGLSWLIQHLRQIAT
jgi:iron complex transport system substrate-binding protein